MAAKKQSLSIPSEQNFSLSKVKLIKDGGITVNYDVTEVVDEESYTNHHIVESAKDIHPDLRELFYDLKPIYGRVFGVTTFLSLFDVKEFKATEKQKEYSNKLASDILDKYDVRSLSFSGAGDKLGVVLSGLFTTENGMKTNLNTPRIKLAVESYGFEEELQEILEKIEKEVYKFLFLGKKAQLSLFGSANTESDDDKEETDQAQENEQVSAEFPEIDDPAENDEPEY